MFPLKSSKWDKICKLIRLSLCARQHLPRLLRPHESVKYIFITYSSGGLWPVLNIYQRTANKYMLARRSSQYLFSHLCVLCIFPLNDITMWKPVTFKSFWGFFAKWFWIEAIKGEKASGSRALYWCRVSDEELIEVLHNTRDLCTECSHRIFILWLLIMREFIRSLNT